MPERTSSLETVALVVMVLASVTMSASAVRNTWLAPAGPASEPSALARYEEGWESSIPASRVLGDSTGRLQLLIFSDLECAGCAYFHETLSALDSARRAAVTVRFVHFPLRSHRFARLAALGAECAAAQGRFEAFVDAVYRAQDRIGLDGWGEFGMRAQVADTSALVACMRGGQDQQPVDAGLQAGEAIALRYTPTVILDGWRFAGTPTDEELTASIDSLLIGRRPIGGAR